MNDPVYNRVVGEYRRRLGAVVEGVRPAHVLAYLAAAGWRALADQPQSGRQVWVRTRATGDEYGDGDEDEEIVASVRVPLFMDYGDYGRRMEQVLEVVAVADDWPVSVSVEVPAMLREVADGGADSSV